MFKRKIYDKLLEWKNSYSDSCALLIEGARRVGKTTLVEEFAKNEYENYLLLDFSIETNRVKELFDDITNLDNFYNSLFFIKDKKLKEGSLIIFDEIQKFPKARQAIKHLVKDGRYHFIETGSLLSIRENVESILIPSEESRLEMYPLDFEEFLWATNNKITADYIKEAFLDKKSIPNGIHNALNIEFRKYLALGGMPKVIDEFNKTKDYYKAHQIKTDIIKLYKDDLHKHDISYNTKTEKIWDLIPKTQLTRSSRFILSIDGVSKRYSTLEKTLGDIVDSKTVNMIKRINEPVISNFDSIDDSFFKLYCCDTGLLVTSIYKNQNIGIKDIYKNIIFDKGDNNLGSVYESIVCQTLISNGYNLYYHTYIINEDNKEKHYEIDFITEYLGKTLAIEVKSGKNFTTSSLDNLKKKYPQLKFERYIISGKSYKKEGDKTYLPIYMAFCL